MESSVNYPFILHWVWGYQTNIAPINLSIQKKTEIFYASGSVGICYDWVKKKQYLLQGHKNDIISIAATQDKKYLVSADSGKGNVLIIWHANTRKIFHVISDYFPSEGVINMCFSSDGDKLMTLIGRNAQELSIWEWKHQKCTPDFTYRYKENAEHQHFVTFHPTFSSHFASCGNKSVYFFEKTKDEIKSALLNTGNLYDDKVSSQCGDFTQTAFSCVSSLAVTATTKGMIIMWGRPLYSRKKPAIDSLEWFVMSPEQRVCIRMIQVLESRCPVSYLSSNDSCFIVGTEKSEILYYDENFSIQWSKCFNEGHINNVSFSFKPEIEFKGAVKKLLGKEIKSNGSPFEGNDFIVSTVEGFVGYYAVASKQLKQILWGTNHLIRSVAVHPVWTYIYFGDYNGGLQKWNYTSKELLNKDLYESACSEIELITIDNKGAYAACVMSNGNLAIFDAVCFTSKPCFTASEVLYRPTMMHFSPDSQHLLLTDASAYVTHYRLQLLVVPEVYQLIQKDKTTSEEPFWAFGGKTRQHQGRIVDSMFSCFKKKEAVFFYTLGEDRFLVQYNISNSKNLNIEVSKRIILERKPVPACMTWYPLYDIHSLIAVLNHDGKMRIYSLDTEKIVRIISLPLYEEPIKSCPHMIGLSKYPIDGNPNTSLGVTSTPSGINIIVPNKEQTYLFTSGLNDHWIFMYEINIMAVLEAEKEGGEGIEAFKYLFPTWYDPDEMKNRLIYSIYSLELEMKMLKLGETENPILKGEVPIGYLEYVLAVLGCFVTPSDLQLMFRDIEFESRYVYEGKKTTLSCLDIMKLYVNYRPFEPVTKCKLKESFNDILAFEEDPDQMTRTRFIDILTTRGDTFSHNELLKVLKCLKKNDNIHEKDYDLSKDGDSINNDNETCEVSASGIESEMKELKELIPEYITEEIFLRDIMCLEKAEEDLSKYILTKEDYNRVQEYPKLEDFVAAVENK